MTSFESKLTVTVSGLESDFRANRLNNEIMNLLLSLYGEGPGDIVIGAEINEYDPDEE
jgi:hypothetical protein